jgi:H+-transporting ATPase
MQGVQYGQITTAIYLKVSVSDFLTLFSARTGRLWFWQVPPAKILLAGGCAALALSSILALFWPESKPDDIETEGLVSDPGLFGFVWLFSIFWWFVQDLCKVLLFKWMLKRNFNGISTTGVVVLPDSAKKLIEELDKALADGNDVDNGKH